MSISASKIRARLVQNGANIPVDDGANYFRIFGFLDGTIRAVSRPGGGPAGIGGAGAPRHDALIQRAFYIGWKHLHGLKWQAVVLANGLIADWYGPCSARHNDLYLLRISALERRLQNAQQHSRRQYALYGDSIYPNLPHIVRRVGRNANQYVPLNAQMSKVRESIEWTFAKLTSLWRFIDFRKNLEILKSPVGKIIGVSALLTNCHTCLYGSEVSHYFDMAPPPLEEYLNG